MLIVLSDGGYAFLQILRWFGRQAACPNTYILLTLLGCCGPVGGSCIVKQHGAAGQCGAHFANQLGVGNHLQRDVLSIAVSKFLSLSSQHKIKTQRGLNVVSTWSQHGLNAVSTWSQRHPDTIFNTQRDLNVVSMLPQRGLDVVSTWSQRGVNTILNTQRGLNMSQRGPNTKSTLNVVSM